MNTILYDKIEEAAFQESSMYNTIQEKNAAYSTGMKIAKFALQNQWISVDEALPPYDENGISKEVIVRTGFNTKKLDRYFANCKEWEYSHKNVTHWMEIPSLKGGEK